MGAEVFGGQAILAKEGNRERSSLYFDLIFSNGDCSKIRVVGRFEFPVTTLVGRRPAREAISGADIQRQSVPTTTHSLSSFPDLAA